MSKEIDWTNIGFSYKPIEKRFVAVCKNGVWSEGELTDDSNIVLMNVLVFFNMHKLVLKA